MSKVKPSWLRVVMDQASNTRPYKFEDGEATTEKQLSLDERAAVCRRAHADVKVAEEVLRDAINHKVDCEGDLSKAEMALERALKEFDEAAAIQCGAKQGE